MLGFPLVFKRERGVKRCFCSGLFWPLWKWLFSSFQLFLSWLCTFFSPSLVLGPQVGGSSHIWVVRAQFKPETTGERCLVLFSLVFNAIITSVGFFLLITTLCEHVHHACAEGHKRQEKRIEGPLSLEVQEESDHPPSGKARFDGASPFHTVDILYFILSPPSRALVPAHRGNARKLPWDLLQLWHCFSSCQGLGEEQVGTAWGAAAA